MPQRTMSSARGVRQLLRGGRVEDLYGGGGTGNLLRTEVFRYGQDEVYRWLQQRHTASAEVVFRLVDEDGYYRRGDHAWKMPYGVRYALRKPLIHVQMSNKFPWYVTWMSPRTGRRCRKYFNSLARAIIFTAERAQYADSHATVVCRHGMLIPPKMRGRLPSPWKWCPCCMKPRKFYRVRPPDTFFYVIRDKTTLKWVDRRLPLLECHICGITNRDDKFRKSNQVWVRRKFKQGVMRARRTT